MHGFGPPGLKTLWVESHKIVSQNYSPTHHDGGIERIRWLQRLCHYLATHLFIRSQVLSFIHEVFLGFFSNGRGHSDLFVFSP